MPPTVNLSQTGAWDGEKNPSRQPATTSMGNNAGDQARGFDAALGDGIFPAQRAGEEHGVAEAEAAAAGDEDGRAARASRGRRQSSTSGRDMPYWWQAAPMTPSIMPLTKSVKERAQAEGDAAGEGDKADGEVVGHDVAGGLGFDADDGLGPHLMALHGGDHLRADEVAHELGAGGGETAPSRPKATETATEASTIADLALEDGGIFVAKEEKERCADSSFGRNR